MFSFYISNDYSHDSKVTFGGYDMKYAGNNETLTWNDLVNTHYWSLNLVGAKIGGNNLPLSSNIAIVDTGTSYMLMPSQDY